MKRIFGILLAVFAAAVFSGCATRMGSFTVISTKNIDWSRVGEYTRGTDETVGKASRLVVLMIQTRRNISIGDAVDEALEKIPGAVALVDAVLREKRVDAILFGWRTYYIEGTALIDPALIDPKLSAGAPPGSGPEGKIVVLSYDDKNSWTKQEVTQAELEVMRQQHR